MPTPVRSLVLCTICNKPVALEETKTDSKGAAVHMNGATSWKLRQLLPIRCTSNSRRPPKG